MSEGRPILTFASSTYEYLYSRLTFSRNYSQPPEAEKGEKVETSPPLLGSNVSAVWSGHWTEHQFFCQNGSSQSITSGVL
jgi:hypothetical protein